MPSTGYFWGKTYKTSDGVEVPGLSVLGHCLNVGHVAQVLARILGKPPIIVRAGVTEAVIGFVASLHDVGKISPGFESKNEVWLVSQGLSKDARTGHWMDDEYRYRGHALVSQLALPGLLRSDYNASVDTARGVSAIAGAHHGRVPVAPTSNPPLAIDLLKMGDSSCKSGIDWVLEREGLVRNLSGHFGSDLKSVDLGVDSPALGWMGGLLILADWLGSDQQFFSPEKDLVDGAHELAALEAIKKVGLQLPPIKGGLTFKDLFNIKTPNDLQVKTFELIQGPGVYVVEAPMGFGKTEAALWASYNLLSQGKARGVYFALPTQATSNRMHLRMLDFVKAIAGGDSRLIHSSSWLFDQPYDPNSASNGGGRSQASDWFRSSKKALLAPFGVGTIDQALLGIVGAKHSPLRQFALFGKVVILDEVHSYDLYTGTLIDQLIQTLLALGCTVIILSATLTGSRKAELLRQPQGGLDTSYPLVSGLNQDGLTQVTAEGPPPLRVRVAFRPRKELLDKAIEAAQAGANVIWVCDTVRSAIQTFRDLKRRGPKVIGLLHSCMPPWQRGGIEKEWFDRLGKDSTTRCGCILVSTQICEQSVDIDGDLLITELAPTDMLLQRIGRLWRHELTSRPLAYPQVYIVEEKVGTQDLLKLSKAKDLSEAFGKKAFVYHPYVLLRTLELWSNLSEVTLPGDIRGLLERTYEDRCGEPQGWSDLKDELEERGRSFKKRALENTNLWGPTLEDDDRSVTRLSDVPKVNLVLCTKIGGGKVTFLDNKSKEYQIPDEKKLDLELARAIHRNSVSIPKSMFEVNSSYNEHLKNYLHQSDHACLVRSNGRIDSGSIGVTKTLLWDPCLGVHEAWDSTL